MKTVTLTRLMTKSRFWSFPLHKQSGLRNTFATNLTSRNSNNMSLIQKSLVVPVAITMSIILLT